MRVLSLFSGVGGFDLGLEASGMKTVFQCEIDKHARKVLDHHWPDVPKWDDVSTLTGKYILENTDGIDVVAWGSPCQDLSFAGKRAGLEGHRSGLFYEGIRIIKELRELSNGKYPTWSIWENVTGALSSNGCADFGQVIYEMENAGAHFSEWAVLDAQYFGVPQRRRRIFLASCFDSATSIKCREPLFSLTTSLPGDSKKSAKQKQTTSRETQDRIGSSGQWAAGSTPNGILTTSVTSKWHKGTGGPSGSEHYNLVIEPTEYIALMDATRVNDVRIYQEPVQTLQSRMGTGGNQTPMVFQDNAKERTTDEVVGSLQARDFKGVSNQYVEENKLIIDSPYVVRRLTPLECERLMGWPDGHTAVTGASDTQRYRMCGNGVASPVAKWVGQQILKNS